MSPPSLEGSFIAESDGYISWLSSSRDLSNHTVRAYESDISALCEFVRNTGGNTSPQTMIENFFDEQRKGGYSPSTLRRRAASVRGFCKYLSDNKFVSTNPWPNNLHFRPRRGLPRAVASSDLNRLLSYLMRASGVTTGCDWDATFKDMSHATTLVGTALMLSTGLRVAELTRISRSNFDGASGALKVVGKGRRERVVFVTDEWQRRLISTYIERTISPAMEPCFLLLNSRGARLSEDQMRARLARASREAGLTNKVTPHMLRHSAATQLIESGVNIRFVQRLLGHASLSTTEIYTHVSDVALYEAIENAGVIRRTLMPDN